MHAEGSALAVIEAEWGGGDGDVGGEPGEGGQKRREGMAACDEAGSIGEGGEDKEHGGNLLALAADQRISDCGFLLAEAEG